LGEPKGVGAELLVKAVMDGESLDERSGCGNRFPPVNPVRHEEGGGAGDGRQTVIDWGEGFRQSAEFARRSLLAQEGLQHGLDGLRSLPGQVGHILELFGEERL
jgi:hypothetical protein